MNQIAFSDEYSNTSVTYHDSQYEWIKKLEKEHKLDENISFAIKSIFANPFCWPIDPYRTLLYILRRKERTQGLQRLSDTIYKIPLNFYCINNFMNTTNKCILLFIK